MRGITHNEQVWITKAILRGCSFIHSPVVNPAPGEYEAWRCRHPDLSRGESGEMYTAARAAVWTLHELGEIARNDKHAALSGLPLDPHLPHEELVYD